MWGWLTAIIQGLVQPLLAWYSTYNQGRNAQRVDDLEATLDTQRRVDDVAHATPARNIDLEWLQRGSRQRPPDGSPPPSDPPTPHVPSEP